MTENSGSGGKRLLRAQDGRMVGGVCTGLARYFGWDVNLIRLAFGIFTVFYGLGALLYGLAWLLVPDEGGNGSILGSVVGRQRL